MRPGSFIAALILSACTSAETGDEDVDTQECGGSIDGYCASHACSTLAEWIGDGECDSNPYAFFRLVERCGDDGTAWSTWTGDGYLFEHTTRWYDASGVLVGVRFTQDYEDECGGFSRSWGTTPACEAWCTWLNCGAPMSQSAACEGGVAPPP